jgi:hypothetical protein
VSSEARRKRIADEIVAHHEAGHFVAMHIAGAITVLSVSIASKDSAGRVTIEIPNGAPNESPTGEDARLFLAWAVGVLAGFHATMRYLRRAPSRLRFCAKGARGDLRAVRGALRAVQRRRAWRRVCHTLAAETVAEQWPTIERLADLLVDLRTVSGTVAAAFVERDVRALSFMAHARGGRVDAAIALQRVLAERANGAAR